jgi:hypothetical protein
MKMEPYENKAPSRSSRMVTARAIFREHCLDSSEKQTAVDVRRIEVSVKLVKIGYFWIIRLFG